MSKNPIQYFIIIILFAIITSCKNESSTNKTLVPRSPEIIDTTAECQQAKTRYQNEKDEELKVIDFFGVKMHGKYEDIINNIYMLPMLSCVERRDTIMLQGNGDKWFSHTVKFCGVPWGMSANFTMNGDNIMSIHDLKFITSKTDDDIIIKVVDELTKHYGEPDISDDKEKIYHWFEPNDLSIRARHFRSSEGGWTFYFYIN